MTLDDHVVQRIKEIRSRLDGVTGKRWKYKPKHEMFVGTTNALDIYHDVINLGRNHEEWVPYFDERANQVKYKLSERSEKNIARIRALGEYLENCREDIEFLLGMVGE